MRGLHLFLKMLFAMSLPAWAELDCAKYLGGLPPLVLQTKDYTCGPACVQSLLNHHSVFNYSEDHLKTFLGTSETVGTTVEQMADGLERLGFSVKVQREYRIDDLVRGLLNSKIYILLLQSGEDAHWVLTNTLKNGHIVVMDPSPDDNAYQLYLPSDLQKLWVTEILGVTHNQLALEVSLPKQQGTL